MRDLITTALEVLGATAVCVGVFTINLSAGLIAAGLCAIGAGALGGRR